MRNGQYESAGQTKSAPVIRCMVEGNCIHSTVRITGAVKNIVVKLLAELGCSCARFHYYNVRGLKVKRLQADEIWSYVGAKKKNVSLEQKAQGWGDVWRWVGI